MGIGPDAKGCHIKAPCPVAKRNLAKLATFHVHEQNPVTRLDADNRRARPPDTVTLNTWRQASDAGAVNTAGLWGRKKHGLKNFTIWLTFRLSISHSSA